MAGRRLLGVAGSALLFAGVFSPVSSAPLLERQTYLQSGRSGAVVLLVLAIVSCLFAIAGRFRALRYTGTIALALIVVTLINLYLSLSRVKSQIDRMPDDPGRAAAAAAVDAI